MDPYPRHAAADVVIVGAGIVGLTIAWELARAGVQRVVLVEAGEPGQQSTGRAAGGIRQQFGDPIEILLSRAALAFYAPMFADADFEGRFERDGYLFLASHDQREALHAAWRVQSELGVGTEWLDTPQLARRFPYIDLTGIEAGTYRADDGFVDPWTIVQWLVRRCRDLGVEIRRRQRVERIAVSHGRVRGVTAGEHTVAADVVVNAAGAWSGAIGELAGTSINVLPSPRAKLMTEAQDLLPSTSPLIVDLSTGSYVRSVHRRIMAGASPEQVPVGFEPEADFDVVEHIAVRTARRFPGLGELRIANVVWGLYEITPDGLPIAGFAEDVTAFCTVAGFNGHGIMHGPPLACALADLILGRTPRIDLLPFSPGRFAHGAAPIGRRTSLI